jgi:hypothetical protein
MIGWKAAGSLGFYEGGKLRQQVGRLTESLGFLRLSSKQLANRPHKNEHKSRRF